MKREERRVNKIKHLLKRANVPRSFQAQKSDMYVRAALHNLSWCITRDFQQGLIYRKLYILFSLCSSNGDFRGYII